MQTPANAVLYTTSDVVLTCAVQVDETVDTAVNVSTSWIGPSGALSNGSRYSVFDTNVSSHEHISEVNVSSLLSSDSGSYTCVVDVLPSLSSPYFVEASSTLNSSTTLQAGLPNILKVTNLLANYFSPPCSVASGGGGELHCSRPVPDLPASRVQDSLGCLSALCGSRHQWLCQLPLVLHLFQPMLCL